MCWKTPNRDEGDHLVFVIVEAIVCTYIKSHRARTKEQRAQIIVAPFLISNLPRPGRARKLREPLPRHDSPS